MTINKKYPIYSFSARWSQDGKHDPEYPNWHKDLPEGRIWNSTGFTKMYRKEKTQKQLDAIVKAWWKKMIEHKNQKGEFPIINPELQYLKAKFKEFETWNCTWFQHESFDEGQTDEEVLQSFEEYVTKTERKNNELEHQYGDEKYNYGYKGLMGAEDRWKWHGAAPNGERDDHSSPPCRCKYCKKQKVLRIAH